MQVHSVSISAVMGGYSRRAGLPVLDGSIPESLVLCMVRAAVSRVVVGFLADDGGG